MTANKEDYINYRIAKSLEVFEDARLLAKNRRWNSCINRLYYSSFYLVSALLYKNAIKPETHNGTKTQFFLHYVKSGIVSKDFGKLYSNLFDWRHESDYADFTEFDEETVSPVIDQVSDFNKILRHLIDK
jgi:uncharacterized protein